MPQCGWLQSAVMSVGFNVHLTAGGELVKPTSAIKKLNHFCFIKIFKIFDNRLFLMNIILYISLCIDMTCLLVIQLSPKAPKPM